MVIKPKKVMKMQLLIASILLSLVSCCKRKDLVRINNYEFHSLYSFGKELKICSDVDVVHNIIDLKSATIIQYTIKGRFMSR